MLCTYIIHDALSRVTVIVHGTELSGANHQYTHIHNFRLRAYLIQTGTT